MRKLLLLLLCLPFAAPDLQAEVKPAGIFGTNMVLQRGEPIKVWGTADGNERVEVTLAGSKVRTRAGRDGKWSVTFARMEAGGPHTMTVKGKDNVVELENILVGEVWLCSGQSNMEWTLASGVDNGADEIAAADYPGIRCFTVRKTVAADPQEEFDGSWDVCSPRTVEHFTAVGYFFARKLCQELEVPVGIVNSSWGGTDIELWTSPGSYEALKGKVAARDYDPAIARDIRDGKPIGNPNLYYSVLYNGMINPMVGFRIKGAIWYQGENNAWNAHSYRTLMPNLVRDWREKWGYDLSFYWVQLANFMAEETTPSESGWAELREAQTMSLSVPKTGQAVIIDIGDADDIHPRNKQDVGLRLALNALHKDYGYTDVICSGPAFASVEYTGGRAVVTFDTFGSKLTVGDKYGYLRGFAVAGEDGVFHWAKAWIGDDNRVTVKSDAVAAPVAVRYAWGNNPGSNLFNAEGLPAGPFRTDDRPGITK